MKKSRALDLDISKAWGLIRQKNKDSILKANSLGKVHINFTLAPGSRQHHPRDPAARQLVEADQGHVLVQLPQQMTTSWGRGVIISFFQFPLNSLLTV